MLALGAGGAGGAAGAQTAPPSAPADTARGAPRVAPPDTARRPAAARGASDSTQRDSVIARQLREERARADRRLNGPLKLDRLRLAAVGVASGMALPDQVVAAPLYALNADYGEIAPDVRVTFGVTYWTSTYRQPAVDAFARAVAAALTPPPAAGAPPPRLGPVRATDIALNADLRFRPARLGGRRVPARVRPWAALGAAFHLLDVQGGGLGGTFVERSLDGLALGAATSLGLDVPTTEHLQLTAFGRYDLFNGAHFASVRAGVSYFLDRRVP